MSIKLTILKTGETIISEMQELVSNNEQTTPHAYLLNNPHVVVTKDKDFLTEEEKNQKKFGIDVIMTPWIILSKDKKMVIPIDSVLTVVEPLESVAQLYLDKLASFKMEELND